MGKNVDKTSIAGLVYASPKNCRTLFIWTKYIFFLSVAVVDHIHNLMFPTTRTIRPNKNEEKKEEQF